MVLTAEYTDIFLSYKTLELIVLKLSITSRPLLTNSKLLANQKKHLPSVNMGRGGKNRGGFKGKKRAFERGEGNRKEEQGSISLDVIKASPEWTSRPEDGDIGRKRKWAVCFGYIGSKYQGLQINPNANTVESHLEKALLLAGCISESNFGELSKIQWSRAARTDKGVHANAQCIAAKFFVQKGDVENAEERAKARQAMIDKLNKLLPEDIWVHHLTKTFKSFNAKIMCCARIYHYLLPSYAFIPKNVMDDYLKGTENDVFRVREKNCLRQYRISEETVKMIETTVSSMEGTHKFHNFSSAGKDGAEGAANRFIKSFSLKERIVDEKNGTQWLLLEIHGQSFLYNQIRKMVAACLDVVRGEVTQADLVMALSSLQKINGIPLAPGIGLYLHEMDYHGYNIKASRLNGEIDEEEDLADISNTSNGNEPSIKKQKTESKLDRARDGVDGDVHEFLDLTCTNASMKSFQRKIWQHIFDQEEKEAEFLKYFQCLEPHTYSISPSKN